jgi:2-octaprenyl-6-methoxyphenol hydroxylase
MAKTRSYDIIVVGGGLVGLIQSIMFAQNDINVLCLDKQSTKTLKSSPFYKRTTAISYGSRQLFEYAGLWDQISPYACPIQSIEVLDGDSPTLLEINLNDDLDAKEADGFGWVVENNHIQTILLKALKKLKKATYKDNIEVSSIKNDNHNVTITTKNKHEFTANLLIGADGRQSFIRKACSIKTEFFSYNQNAIVSIVEHEKPHQNTAVEHFKSSGPFAILPMINGSNNKNRSSIVWTEDQNEKNSILKWDKETYLTALRQQLPASYGDILDTSERFSYPLGFVHAHQYIAERVALIGDAAHGIHPVAGQGLNLGLRDVATLSELIIEAKTLGKDIGNKKILSQYQDLRQSDNSYMSFLTDGLNRLFANDKKTIRTARKIGLKLFNKIKPARHHFISQMMGTSGRVPNILKRKYK